MYNKDTMQEEKKYIPIVFENDKLHQDIEQNANDNAAHNNEIIEKRRKKDYFIYKSIITKSDKLEIKLNMSRIVSDRIDRANAQTKEVKLDEIELKFYDEKLSNDRDFAFPFDPKLLLINTEESKKHDILKNYDISRFLDGMPNIKIVFNSEIYLRKFNGKELRCCEYSNNDRYFEYDTNFVDIFNLPKRCILTTDNSIFKDNTTIKKLSVNISLALLIPNMFMHNFYKDIIRTKLKNYSEEIIKKEVCDSIIAEKTPQGFTLITKNKLPFEEKNKILQKYLSYKFLLIRAV